LIATMTDKQLQRLATAAGWIKERNGSKHQLWRHSSGQTILLPYRPKQHTARLLAKRLEAATA
jgi:predicted RNA binding protein YcfA (HicA-like mRNA interferase family)